MITYSIEEAKKIAVEKGYSINLSIQENCLYCSNADMNYLFSDFENIENFKIVENGKPQKLQLVHAPQYNIKGYYITH